MIFFSYCHITLFNEKKAVVYIFHFACPVIGWLAKKYDDLLRKNTNIKRIWVAKKSWILWIRMRNTALYVHKFCQNSIDGWSRISFYKTDSGFTTIVVVSQAVCKVL